MLGAVDLRVRKINFHHIFAWISFIQIVTVDGAMLASRDFGFMLFQGVSTMLMQLFLLSSSWCSSISNIFATFALRLGSYAVFSLVRATLGIGRLGIALRTEKVKQKGNANCDNPSTCAEVSS